MLGNFGAFGGPRVCDWGVCVEFEGRLALDVDGFGEVAGELWDEAEEEVGLLSWFDDGVLIMAVEFSFSIFEPMGVDSCLVVEVKFEVYCWVANVFDSDAIFGDVIDGHIEGKL